MIFSPNISLKSMTSWLVGGCADWYCLPENEEDLKSALKFAHEKNMPWTVLSGGSNVLISDQGVEGLVIHMQKYSQLSSREEGDDFIIHCLSGTPKSELLKVYLKNKLAPALFLAGLPGDVGGGLVMNAGVSESFIPREFCEIVDCFTVIKIHEGKVSKQKYSNQDILWSYRHSQGWQEGIISEVVLRWKNEKDEQVLNKVREANQNRLRKQPLDKPSCGSVFVNPVGYKAAQLIDQCDLKGFQIGGAGVSTKHANFIVNLGNATATDIEAVMAHVQETVFQRTGVRLKSEVVWLGRK